VPRLSEIRGQDRVVGLLRRALEADRVPHAYLFCGPAGSGKHTVGLALAGALNCDTEPGEGCHSCTPCSKIDQSIHPDVYTLEREGAARIIPIETIRRDVLGRVALSPHEARARVILIEEAAALQGPAANALLKTLEEPPDRTHFILGTTAPDQLLPTIRSRCQRVSFAELPPDVRAELSDDDEGKHALDEAVQSLLDAAQRGTDGQADAAARKAAADRTLVGPVLELLAFRLANHSRDAAIAGDRDRAARASGWARLALDTHVAVTLHNAHGQLALDRLLRRMRVNRGPIAAPAGQR